MKGLKENWFGLVLLGIAFFGVVMMFVEGKDHCKGKPYCLYKAEQVNKDVKFKHVQGFYDEDQCNTVGRKLESKLPEGHWGQFYFCDVEGL